MSWEDGSSYLEEMAPGVYAFVQPDGGWMVNNCGVITDASGDAVIVDTTSTEKRNRAFLAEVAGVTARDPKIAVNTHSHPDLTIDSDITLHLDEFPVELKIMGPAHSTNDVGIWLPEQQVMFAGDLAFSGGHPIFMEGSMLGFRAATRRMRDLAPDVLLPGHGPVCRGEDV